MSREIKPVLPPNLVMHPAATEVPAAPVAMDPSTRVEYRLVQTILAGIDPNQVSAITFRKGRLYYETNWRGDRSKVIDYDYPDDHIQIRIDKEYIHIPLTDGSIVPIPNKSGRYIVHNTIIEVSKASNGEISIRTYEATTR